MTSVRTRRRPTSARVTATIEALQSRYERVFSIDHLSSESSCSFVALSDTRIWFGMPDGNGVATYRYKDVSALAITDPFADEAVWVKVTTGGEVWSIRAASGEHAIRLFREISGHVYPVADLPDNY